LYQQTVGCSKRHWVCLQNVTSNLMTKLFGQYFLLTFLLLKSFGSFSQNKSRDKSSIVDKSVDNELYVFMQIVTTDLNLNKSFGLSGTPDTSFQYQKINRDFLSKFLVDTVKNSQVTDSSGLFYPDLNYDSRKCLTKEDIASMLKKKKIIPSFKWQKSKLGFSATTKKEWYSFSLPIFNADSSKAIILVRYTCDQFMCGNGDIFVFLKADNKWGYVSLVHWDN